VSIENPIRPGKDASKDPDRGHRIAYAAKLALCHPSGPCRRSYGWRKCINGYE